MNRHLASATFLFVAGSVSVGCADRLAPPSPPSPAASLAAPIAVVAQAPPEAAPVTPVPEVVVDDDAGEEPKLPRWLRETPATVCERYLLRQYHAATSALGEHLEDDRLAGTMVRLSDFFHCVDDAHGGWGVTVTHLGFRQITRPGADFVEDAVEGKVLLTRFEGEQVAREEVTQHDFDVIGGANESFQLKHDDSDGDGRRELYFAFDWIDGGIGNDHFRGVRVFRWSHERIEDVHVSPSVKGFDDVDKDGHLDWIEAGTFFPGPPGLGGPDNEEWAAIPWHMARGMGDGTFREDVPEARTHLRKQCPKPTPDLFTEDNGYHSRYDAGMVAACARYWGVSPREIEKQAREHREIEVDARFLRWVRRQIAARWRLAG